LQKKHYLGKTIGVKLRYDDFRIVTRALTLPSHTDDAGEIRRAAGQCLKRVPLDQRLRLLGVRAGSLCTAAALLAEDGSNRDIETAKNTTLSLFDQASTLDAY